MFNEKYDIIVKGIKIGKWSGFDYPEEAVLCFDGLVLFPSKELIDKYNIKSEAEYLSFILPYVAKLFKVDRHKLLEEWISDYGIYRVFKGK